MTSIASMDFGKVRNTALLSDGRRVVHTTDRISAFDVILPFDVPGKGSILQALSLWFFRATRDIVSNHVVGALDETHLLINSAKVFPVEFVVRGFLTGSLWRLYQAGGPGAVRAQYGVELPMGMEAGDAFSRPILTPTSKAIAGHDEPVTLERAASLVPDFSNVHKACLALFERGQDMARQRGLVLVDTKYEFGLDAEGKLMVVDEIHTPDSSRYWLEEDLGKPRPRSLSKEMFREILIEMFGGAEKIGMDFANHPRFRDAAFVNELRGRIVSRYSELLAQMVGLSPQQIFAADKTNWPVEPKEFSRWESETRLPAQVLVCGNGGRDHTLAQTLARCSEVRTVHFSPCDRSWGDKCVAWPDKSGRSMENLVAEASRSGVGLVVAGPEAAIVAGVGDACRARGVPVVAPTVSCAALEWSKIFCKEVATEADIPTAAYRVWEWASLRAALGECLRTARWTPMGREAPFVVKYDGLAAGKGVFLVRDFSCLPTVLETLDAELEGWQRQSPSRGEARFLVEDMLTGEEMSVIALCSGQSFRLLPLARDYKRRNNGQEGPNTGGMGSVCPIAADEALLAQFRQIFERTLAVMERRGLAYHGFLYAGCMVDAKGVAWLLEFNCRLGDPECQVMLPGLGRDFLTELWRVAQGLPFWQPNKSGEFFTHDGRSRVLVVAASPEYPTAGAPERKVHLPSAENGTSEGVEWAVAGVDARGKTRAGRILGAVGAGVTVKEARERAYGAVSRVTLEGEDGVVVSPHFRTDIGAEFSGEMS